MTEATQQIEVGAPQTPAATLEQRLAGVHESLRDDSGAEPVADATSADATPPATAQVPAAAASAPDAKALERRARLEALQAREREKQDSNAKRAERDRELDAIRKKAEEAEARAEKRVDLDGLDEAGILRLMQERGIRPEKLGEWIRESVANPERAAEAAARDAARKAVDPHVARLEARLAAAEAKLAEAEKASLTSAFEAEERAATNAFVKFTGENAAAAPFASNFLNTHGEGEFYKLALGATQHLPPGAGWQAVLDHIEENLSALAPVFASSNPTASTPPKHAAAKAKTVSNSLAQERASVVEEEDFASLPYEERVARLRGPVR